MWVVVIAAIVCGGWGAANAAAAVPRGIALSSGGVAAAAVDASTGRGVAITSRVEPDPNGLMSGVLTARGFGRTGRPAGGASTVATGVEPDLIFGGSGPQALVADPVRHRYLLAYLAHKAGMANEACPPMAPTFPPLPLPECRSLDVEVFVQVLSGTGAPVGSPRQVTSVGPPDKSTFRAAAPSLAFDGRSFLLTFAGTISGDDLRGALFAQRLDEAGAPVGGAVQLGPESFAPQSRLVGDPRGGFLLAYSMGAESTSRALFTQRLDAGGGLAGPSHQLPTLPGGGTGSVDLVMDPRRRRALVISSTSQPGSSGFQAQQVKASGAAASSPVRLRLGADGGMVAAPGVKRGTWVYGFSRSGKKLSSVVYLRNAAASGRPTGRAAVAITQPSRRSSGPMLALGRRGVFALWSEEAFSCRGDACLGSSTFTTRARLIGG